MREAPSITVAITPTVAALLRITAMLAQTA